MAKYYADGNYVVVQSGDTLSSIAAAYKTQSGGKTYKQIASIKKNNITNVNRIYVGQKIYLSEDGGSVSPVEKKPTKDPDILQFGRKSTDEKVLFATWKWSKYKDKTASYKVLWTYDTDKSKGTYIGQTSSVTVDKDAPEAALYSEFSIPDTALHVKFKVKPIAESKTENNKETFEWTANWSEEKIFNVTDEIAPEKPTKTLTVDIVDYKLVVSVNDLESEITTVDFRIYKDYGNNPLVTKNGCAVVNGRASYSHAISAGSAYTVQYRVVKNKLASEWSSISDAYSTKPDAPSEITAIRVTEVRENDKQGSVYLEWSPVNAANSIPNDKVTYDIQYSQKKEYFDISDQPTKKTGIENTKFTIVDLETGKEYFFRVRATNSKGSSAWTELVSIIVGSTPEPPTTWSSVTTAIVGEDVWLYWMHNASDNSHQKYAELELYIDGVKCVTPTLDKEIDDSILTYIPLTEDEMEDGKTHSCLLKTSQYAEGTKFKWSIQTAGITGVLSKLSTQRTVDVYAVPTLELSMLKRDGTVNDDGSYNLIDIGDNTLTSFPFYLHAVAGPNTQAPIGYHVTIASKSIYETTDNIGNPKTVNVGEQVYSKYFDTMQALQVEFTPGNISLENNIEYTLTCTVSMNSGLSATETIDLTVNWDGALYEPNAAITIDRDTLTAFIRPYCVDYNTVYRKVIFSEEKYEMTNVDLGYVYGEVVDQARTDDGEQVYSGTTVNGEDVYFCIITEATPITDVYLSVYRREFDGSFTEIAKNLDGSLATTITDPHPSLDFARYRVVATDKETGAISYYDLPAYPVGEPAVIIQWDELWSSFEAVEDAELEQPPWSGSLLRLPYNIDVSENVDPEVEMIEYIGRSNPVSYYGTQRRQSATWNVVIDKADKETVYSLRRLANWMNDAYVREPSGIGYWAHVVVSFNQTHRETTIPVTLTITRVEGGM